MSVFLLDTSDFFAFNSALDQITIPKSTTVVKVK